MINKASRIKIAEIIGNANSGGVLSHIYNYCSNMDRSSIELHFFTYGPSLADEKLRALGAEVHYLPNFINFPAAMRAFAGYADKIGFDIVHSHLTSLSVFPLKVAANKKVPVRICHAHSTTNNKEITAIVKNSLKHFSTKFATDLFACSKLSAKWLYGKKCDDAIILRNAINLDKFTFNPQMRDKIRAEYNIQGLAVGHIGRFEYQKNLPFLIETFNKISAKITATLILVGGGSREGELRKMIATLGLSDKVRFLPESAYVERYYSAFDCFLLPSHYEGLPLVGIEAQAMGLPCFISNTVTTEMDIGGHNTYLPINNPEVWAEAAIKYASIGRYDCHAGLRENGYDIATESSKLQKLYIELANNQREE